MFAFILKHALGVGETAGLFLLALEGEVWGFRGSASKVLLFGPGHSELYLALSSRRSVFTLSDHFRGEPIKWQIHTN